MLEARTFVSGIDNARKTLQDRGAILKGEYRCKDIIFSPLDSTKSLADEFLRLRINVKNIWDEKDVIVVIKQTKKKGIGKDSLIPLRKEFDSELEARKFIDQNLQNHFQYDFEFTRTGWQYDLGENQVDLERVEDIPSCYTIEVKSSTERELKKLVDLLSITSLIKGSSVVEMKRLVSKF
ncbi:MAG: hypothetical protein AAB447_04155 [Patescibacteria group bacterium]